MKKLMYIGALLAVLLSSCVQDVDDVFSNTASERVQNEVRELQALLLSQEHGWVMEYYPQAKQSYGGFIYTLAFDENDQVTVSGEFNDDASAKRTSLYSIQTDMGPTLNFDTYNEIFHYLADPDPHSYSNYGFWESGLQAGNGFEGDYEFVLQSKSANEIILQGKKTKNRIRMVPLQESAESYLTKLIAMKQKVDDVPVGTVGFKGMVDGKELYFEQDQMRHLAIYYDGEVVGSAAVCPTLDGMAFYEPLKVAGRSMQHFSFADNAYTCLDEGATDVTLKSYRDPAFLAYGDFVGTYEMAYDNTKRDVTVEALVEGETLLIKGFSPNFNVVMTYDGVAGKAYIYSQKIATVGDRDIWLSAWDSDTGNLTWGTSIGMVTEWNQSTDNFVLTFKDFGSYADHVVYGWYYYSFPTGTTSNGGFFSGWGSNYFCANLKTLTKKQ